jgi:maltoporin
MERLQNKYGFGLMAVSLGYADTLMSLSAASTSSELSESDKAKADISDGYVRMSVGVTGECGKCRIVSKLSACTALLLGFNVLWSYPSRHA